MRVLLDTHIYLWTIQGNVRLASKARKTIRDADEVFISSAVIWEAAIKARLGKLAVDIAQLVDAISHSGFQQLSITVEHAAAVHELPDIHRDPFDRILIAQAQCDRLWLLTADKTLAAYCDCVILV